MSIYICRQCASAQVLRRGSFKAATFLTQDTLTNSEFYRPSRPTLSRFQSTISAKKSPISTGSISEAPTSTPSEYQPSQLKILTPTTPLGYDDNKARGLNIRETRDRIDRLIKYLEVDKLYLEFWRICCTEELQDQRGIWRNPYQDDSRLESLYRAFNTSAQPTNSSYPVDLLHEESSQISPAKLTVLYNDNSIPISPAPPASLSSRQPSESNISPKGSLKNGNRPLSRFDLRFIGSSHAKRLLQIHHYFEQVLGLRVGYYPQVALIVALASRGDMITAQKIFRKWQKYSRHSQSSTKRSKGPETGGKEMYSAVIRGLVGRNYPESDQYFNYTMKDRTTGIRSGGVTQTYAALELFYDLLRRGGTPTFEIYHSLIIGLACFKNDMEAAELLLDHMIMKKSSPYVPVLHIMCREYARRKDFRAAERIFGLLKEYNIQPKAITCNVMLRAVFQLSTMDALANLDQSSIESDGNGHGNDNDSDLNHQLEPKDLDAKARQLKRQKIKQLREYMRENGVSPDEATFSTLFYGYGHLEDGYPDLRATMVEMSRQVSPKIEPNQVIFSSLIFAHLNHGKTRTAESILDQMLHSTHPVEDSTFWFHQDQQRNRRRKGQQSKSPFRKQREEEGEEGGKEDVWDVDSSTLSNELSEPKSRQALMVPGKGAFHALMLSYIEKGDIVGMERVLDKMIQSQHYQEKIRSKLRLGEKIHGPFVPMVDLEADEYTANIMLLGYITTHDSKKVELVLNQIRSRPDWVSNSLFMERDRIRGQLVDFLKQQSSKAVVERTFQESCGVEHDSLSSSLPSSSVMAKLDPLSGNIEGELDDDIEIDVTAISAKLRGLMSSSHNKN
ncbi:hypothetical protein BGZ46_009257 [Entomortierella lignicola]|nr:hypothetical protein BGZ46_009257 [Entomortierella lignicola]